MERREIQILSTGCRNTTYYIMPFITFILGGSFCRVLLAIMYFWWLFSSCTFGDGFPQELLAVVPSCTFGGYFPSVLLAAVSIRSFGGFFPHASPAGYSSRRYSTNQTTYSCPGPGSMY